MAKKNKKFRANLLEQIVVGGFLCILIVFASKKIFLDILYVRLYNILPLEFVFLIYYIFVMASMPLAYVIVKLFVPQVEIDNMNIYIKRFLKPTITIPINSNFKFENREKIIFREIPMRRYYIKSGQNKAVLYFFTQKDVCKIIDYVDEQEIRRIRRFKELNKMS